MAGVVEFKKTAGGQSAQDRLSILSREVACRGQNGAEIAVREQRIGINSTELPAASQLETSRQRVEQLFYNASR
jgi:hypothetical protein